MINFPFYIARRYIFSKKSHNAINIISGISVCGVALATMALVCTLSVFNGFRDMVASFFTAFDPELKITLVEGKAVASDDPSLAAVKSHPFVAVYTECLEDKALVACNGRQAMVTIKGVDETFVRQADLKHLLYGDGEFILKADVLQYGVLGIGLASVLGLGTDFEQPLSVYAPKKGERVNLANPLSAFTQDELLSPGVVFSVKQVKYDASTFLLPLIFHGVFLGGRAKCLLWN